MYLLYCKYYILWPSCSRDRVVVQYACQAGEAQTHIRIEDVDFMKKTSRGAVFVCLLIRQIVGNHFTFRFTHRRSTTALTTFHGTSYALSMKMMPADMTSFKSAVPVIGSLRFLEPLAAAYYSTNQHVVS